MGVRGLTGYIARNAELYLMPYELHDCNLVIDGDNLACNLYNQGTGAYPAFGGDYDTFYRAVVNFFAVLGECNIKAYVLMDGGYEYRKLRTVGKRMRGKISVIKRITPCASTVFPLMMKEVFVDAVKDCNVPIMRCAFEADDELAALSRKLKCPVLSYDSDFYIHNVKYIPFITLTVKAHTKVCKSNKNNSDDDDKRILRKNEVKKLEKRTKANRIMGTIVVNNKEKPKKGKSYKYLDCCIYRIENLIARGSLSKAKLPLFAAMLGNDYISGSSFKYFFLSGMGKLGRSRKTTQQQRRIKVILEWLKNETAESAMQKIMARLRKNERESLMAQVEGATSGYCNEKCRSFDYIKNNYKNVFDFTESEDEEHFESEVEKELEIEGDEESENEEDEESGNEEDDMRDVDDNGSSRELEKAEQSENILTQEGDNLSVSHNSNNDVFGESESKEELEEDKNDIISSLPGWFLDKLYSANLPRFFVDLIYLRKYINIPQIEHFPFEECNGIALPILKLIYSLLNNVKGEEYVCKEMEDGTVRPLFFTYLTRCTRITNIHYKHIEIEEKPKHDFVPEYPNPIFLKTVFDGLMPEWTSDDIFDDLEKLPQDLRLYFMAIVYWLQKSKHCNVVHLNSLIVCLVILRTIDSKIPPERNSATFRKKYGKILKKERQVRDEDEASGLKRKIKDEILALPIPDRLQHIPKSDCYLIQSELLKHFHMQVIFKKKYDLYSTTILHSFAEFQAVVFQLHSLNALLDFPYSPPHMEKFYCGVFLYNLYDLLKSRLDIEYYIKTFTFRDSQIMFDFYLYLFQWCQKYLPTRIQSGERKKVKKKRQQGRRLAEKENIIKDPNAAMLSSDEFLDLNNKFCTFLKI